MNGRRRLALAGVTALVLLVSACGSSAPTVTPFHPVENITVVLHGQSTHLTDVGDPACAVLTQSGQHYVSIDWAGEQLLHATMFGGFGHAVPGSVTSFVPDPDPQVLAPATVPRDAADMHLTLQGTGSSIDPPPAPSGYVLVSGTMTATSVDSTRIHWSVDADLMEAGTVTPVVGHVSGTFSCRLYTPPVTTPCPTGNNHAPCLSASTPGLVGR